MADSPRLLVVGGPNGSGKTTLALEYAAETGFPYLGADAIADSLNPADPESVRIAASRKFLTAVDDGITQKQSLVVESTLSGLTLRNKIHNAKALGFNVSTVFLFVDSANICIERVAERVRKGGHHVPESDIRRRFDRSIRNFWSQYREMADNWVVVYNGERNVRDVAAGSHDKTSIRDSALFSLFLALVEDSSND